MSKPKKIQNPETGEWKFPWFDDDGNMLDENGNVAKTDKEREAVVRRSMNVKEIK